MNPRLLRKATRLFTIGWPYLTAAEILLLLFWIPSSTLASTYNERSLKLSSDGCIRSFPGLRRGMPVSPKPAAMPADPLIGFLARIRAISQARANFWIRSQVIPGFLKRPAPCTSQLRDIEDRNHSGPSADDSQVKRAHSNRTSERVARAARDDCWKHSFGPWRRVTGEPGCSSVPGHMRVGRNSTAELPGLHTQMDRQRAVASTARKDGHFELVPPVAAGPMF
jgi:hypothetical protein